MANINFNKHIWEGWTVQDFIEDIEYSMDIAVQEQRRRGNPIDREFIRKTTSSQQPYYKKVIPDVVNYFCDRYNVL